MTATRLASTTSSGGLPAGWVSVKDAPYNAKGDNATDDSAAIQAAINDAKNFAVSTVSVVYFPPGNYLVATTLHADNAGKAFALIGPEQGAQYQESPAKLCYTGTTSTLTTGGLITFNSSTGWKMANLALEYNNAAFTGHLIQVDGSTGGGDSQDWHITHCTTRARSTNTAASAIRLHKAVIGTIDFCHLTGAGYGVQYSDTVSTSYVVSVVVEKCTFNFIRSADLGFLSGDGEMLTVRDCVFEAGTNTTAIAGGVNCRLYKPLIEGCWAGDATGTTIWIDGLVTQSNSHIGTVRDNMFFSGGTITDVFFKMGAVDGSNNCGAWLVTGNSYLGSGNAFDTYTPGTSFRDVVSIANSWVSATNVWKSGTAYPANYIAFGNQGEADTTDRIGFSGNTVVEAATSNGETLVVAGQTGAAGGAFATLPGTTKVAVYFSFGPSFAPRLTLQSANVLGSEIVLGAGTTPAKTVYVKDNKLGFYDATPVVKAGAIATPNTQTASYVQADVQSLKTAIDSIRTVLQNLGLTA